MATDLAVGDPDVNVHCPPIVEDIGGFAVLSTP